MPPCSCLCASVYAAWAAMVRRAHCILIRGSQHKSSMPLAPAVRQRTCTHANCCGKCCAVLDRVLPVPCLVCSAGCAAGYAFPSAGGTATCSQCPAGTYQPGYLGNDVSGANFGAGTTCLTCVTTRSVYISSKGNETEYVSDGTTYRTAASSRDECVPQTAQLGIDVGTKFFADDIGSLLTTASTGTYNTPQTCIEQCGTTASSATDNVCCFVQFDYAYRKNGTGGPAAKTCKFVKMTPFSTTAALTTSLNLVFYKMLPSDAITAASVSKVEAKAMSSGLYARCSLPTGWEATGTYDSDKIGRRLFPNLTPALDATTPAGLAECKRKCDMMSICWGFTVKLGLCELRGGFDEMDVRSFFRNPLTTTEWNW